MASGRFVQSAELERNSKVLLKDISTHGETCYITENGRAKAVLMDINRYNALMDLIEESEAPKYQQPVENISEYASVRTFLNRAPRFAKRRKN